MSMNDQQSNIYKHSMKLERRTASLYVQNTGCQQCPPSYGWGPGVRNHFLLHHVVRGRGVYICRDQRYELRTRKASREYSRAVISSSSQEEVP